MNAPLSISIDADGIAVAVIDLPGKSMNVIDEALTSAIEALTEQVRTDAAIKGVIITSGKDAFLAGADLQMLERVDTSLGAAALKAALTRLPKALRALETSGKPVVAAVNGTALGGGLEIALACHRRIVADDETIRLGLPEVQVGLMPGGGGTQRLPRLIGVEKALKLCLEGAHVSPREALKLGFADEVAPRADLVERARQWLLSEGEAVQPWDRKGFRTPGRADSRDSSFFMLMTMANGMTLGKSIGLAPAPRAILSAIYEGVLTTIDHGLEVEAREFTRLFLDPRPQAMIRTLFLSKQKADKLMRRPANVPASSIGTLGVLGAGMMGAGVAYVAAKAGMNVVLIDRDDAAAEAGRDYGRKVTDRLIKKGRMSAEAQEALLARITATSSYDGLREADLVIEAVFEDPAVKAEVFQKARAAMGPKAVLASNTSTLRITALAEQSGDPGRFIGLHFFSPVDRMPLVEVIKGEASSEETLARALDFVAAIRKTPIVVNDGWGFYTSRCFASFTAEGMAMLAEGIAPALIENGAKQAGMPVGPLAVQDEVSLELSYNVMQSLKQVMGEAYKETPADPVIARFVAELGRPGRKAGKGFYDYPADGPKKLWSGLGEHYPQADHQPAVEDISRRFLYRQAIEAARCLEEGIVDTPEEADLGAIFGWGYPAHTGGPLSLIDMAGLRAFVEDCQAFEAAHGARFAPPAGLIERAKAGDAYYG